MRSSRLTGVADTQVLVHRVSRPFSRVRPGVGSSAVKFLLRKASRPQVSRRGLSGTTTERNSVVLPGLTESAKDVEALALLDQAVLRSNDAEPSSSASAKRATLETPEELASTAGHKAIVTVAFGILVAIASEGLASLHGTSGLLGVASAVGLAFVLAGEGGASILLCNLLITVVAEVARVLYRDPIMRAANVGL